MGLLIACGSPVAADWPVLEPPPGAQTQSVAEDMKFNGVPMRIQQFSSQGSTRNVLWFYRQKWSDGGKKKVAENQVGGWDVVGTQSGDYYLTVQVRPAPTGGTEGLISASRLPSMESPPQFDMSFPRMPGSMVISDVDSNDRGKTAKTLIMQNDYSVTSNLTYYESVMPSFEWRQDTRVKGPNQQDRSVLFFERQKESASIVINPNPRGGTMVVVNIVSRGL